MQYNTSVKTDFTNHSKFQYTPKSTDPFSIGTVYHFKSSSPISTKLFSDVNFLKVLNMQSSVAFEICLKITKVVKSLQLNMDPMILI